MRRGKVIFAGIAAILTTSLGVGVSASPDSSPSHPSAYFDYADYYLRRFTDRSARAKQDPYRFYNLYDYYKSYYSQEKADPYKFYLNYDASRSEQYRFMILPDSPKSNQKSEAMRFWQLKKGFSPK